MDFETRLRYKKHKLKVSKCRACSLYRTKTNYVVGRGKLPCDILLIGEAPGVTEDRFGKPFVGASGRLLNNMLEKIPGVSFYITNTLACRPVDNQDKNRTPFLNEVQACSERVSEIFKIAKPKGVIAVGKIALHACEDVYSAFNDVPLVSIYHPAYLLRIGSAGEHSKLYVDTLTRILNFCKGVQADGKTKEN